MLSDEVMCGLYEDDHKSCAEIARICQCSETSIYNHLKSLGVVMRSRSEANKIFPDNTLIVLYNIGLSSSQIAKLLLIDPSTIIKRLHSLGFPLRSRSVASMIRYTDDEFEKHFLVPEVVNQLLKT